MPVSEILDKYSYFFIAKRMWLLGPDSESKHQLQAKEIDSWKPRSVMILTVNL